MSFGRSQTCHRRCLSYGNYHVEWSKTIVCCTFHVCIHVYMYTECCICICTWHCFTNLYIHKLTYWYGDHLPFIFHNGTKRHHSFQLQMGTQHCRLVLNSVNLLHTLLKHLSKWGMAFLRVTGWLQVAQWIVRSSLSASPCEGCDECEERVWGVWWVWGAGVRGEWMI